MRLPRTVLLALAALLAATATHAQIAFRAASQAGVAAATSPTHVGVGTVAAVNAANCPSITPSVPAGSVGDLLIAAVSSGDNVAINMAGWNTLFAHAPVGNYQAKLFWRIAQATNASTITRGAASGCNVLLGRISRFTGVDPVEPIQGIFAPGTLPGGTQPACTIPGGGNWCYQNLATVTTGTQTTIDADALLVMTAHTSDNSNITGGLPAGFTFHWESTTTFGNDASIALFSSPQTATGTFGPYTMNKNRGSDPNHGVLFALRSVGLRIPVPAGTALNDVMIATIAARPCSATSGAACTTSVTAPLGWTLVNSTSQTGGGGTGGFGNVLVTYRRVATAVDAVPGTTYKWTFGGSPVNAGAVGAITSYSGVDTTNPVVVDAGQATPTGFTHTAPSIDTGTVASTMLVSSHTANSSATWTSPPGMTEAADRASLATPNDQGLSLEVNYELRATAGATGTRTATHANPPASDTGAAHMLALRPAVTVAHYAISLLSSTVATCALAEVTITAHNTLHAASAPPGTRTVTLSTSTGTGVWQPALVAGAGLWTPSGLNNGLATYRWSGGETNFTVRLAQSVAATLSINLSDGFVVEDPTEDPPLTFAASALRVSDGANVPLAIGNQIALKPSNTGVGSQALFLQAVQTSGGACTGMFPVGSEIDFEVGAQCNSPAACTRNVTLTTTATSGSPTGVFVPNGAFPAVIRFRITTANAEAPFFFNYADAGQITLQFRRALPPPPAGAFVAGTSNPFVTRPFGFAFRGADAATPVQHGTLPTSAPLAAAGDNFTMTLAAYAWASAEDDGTGNPLPGANITDNGLTPNFAASTTVSATGNLPGVATGAMSRGVGCGGAATIAAGSWSGGSATAGDWCYSEAGNAFLSASATSYFGIGGFDVGGNSGLDGTGAAGGYVGRFRPKWFELTGTPAFTPRFDAACAPTSTFAYMNEPIRLDGFRMQAVNTQNVRTRNYDGAYALHVPNPGVGGAKAAFAIGARSGTTDRTARISATHVTVPAWSQGLLETAGANPLQIALSFDRNATDTPDGPFAATSFGIAPADSDGVILPAYDLDVDNNAINDHLAVGTTDVRFGRLVMQSIYGPANRDLPVMLETQFWDGNALPPRFSLNTVDSCTRFLQSDFGLTFAPAPVPAAPDLVACETAMLEANITFASGRATLTMAKPGLANPGTVRLTANLDSAGGTYCPAIGAPGSELPATNAAKGYLRGKWDDGAAYDDKPTASAGFGLYGSQPKNFIFLRENY